MLTNVLAENPSTKLSTIWTSIIACVAYSGFASISDNLGICGGKMTGTCQPLGRTSNSGFSASMYNSQLLKVAINVSGNSPVET